MTLEIQGCADLIRNCDRVRPVGRVVAVEGAAVQLGGLLDHACIGDRIALRLSDATLLDGEVVQITRDAVVMLPQHAPHGVALGDAATLIPGGAEVTPGDAWIGRIIDPYGNPLDGAPLMPGAAPRRLMANPPPAAERLALGARMQTGLAVTNTLLPITAGQRIGLFAGSGVGKSRLLARLAQNMEADVVVIAMIGERGREVRHFVDKTLGAEGLARSVIVAATSDQSPLVRRRCAWTAMATAEHFRDQGLNVLFLADSVTRFAEAHREIASVAGEPPALRGYPPSTSHMIMSLCERAGPGTINQGFITAIFSVLVAGSDMDEPIADILRGVLDGHIVLDREIAERGRYPAINVLRSVSRSLPEAATEPENAMLTETRRLLGAYEQSQVMIKAGLYVEGSDPLVDRAIRVWSDLDEFLSRSHETEVGISFDKLGLILRRSRQGTHGPT
ncbi:FliI/YscN family ATPase [Thalassococcus sp. S3]|uniref:FliI/YscN family ATPase n=1 Tax=Thalassococcus sp. S3 TaxID=2017482 RepID=UPI0010243368|nr:FliI/YscN family ATPase [Thalassococcus sp. S3]QBF29709.1 flagellum-specific ATP synthase FliI [Thalassococcus sp. S3]